MLRNCRAPQRSRLLGKFTENDHEKVDRLLEMHFKYLEKVDDVDQQIESDRRVRWRARVGSLLSVFATVGSNLGYGKFVVVAC